MRRRLATSRAACSERLRAAGRRLGGDRGVRAARHPRLADALVHASRSGAQCGDDATPDLALTNTVTPDYFRTMGIPMRAGSDFVALDDTATPPQAIVNEELVHRFVAGPSRSDGASRRAAAAT